MPANIMSDWGMLQPSQDFYKSFMAPLIQGQDLAKSMMQNQMTKEYLPYNLPMIREELKKNQLGNQATNLSNQRNEKLLPFVTPQAEADLNYKLLQNELQRFNVKTAPQKWELDQQKVQIQQALYNLKQQDALREAENPGLSAPGKAGQIAWANYYKSIGDENSYNQIIESMNKPANGAFRGIAGQIQAAEQYRAAGNNDAADLIMEGVKNTTNMNRKTWKGLPALEKRENLAWAKGMGYDQLTAAQKFAEGDTLEDLAAEKGMTVQEMQNTVTPVYGATTANLTAAQKRESAEAELQHMSDKFQQWVEPYVTVGSIGRLNPKQLMDKLSGNEDPEQIARFLAGVALYPEVSGARGRTLGLNMGITSLRHLEQTGLGNLKAYTDLVSPEVWTRAQELLTEEIGEASELANDVIYNPEKYKNKNNKELVFGNEETYPKELKNKLQNVSPEHKSKASDIVEEDGNYYIIIDGTPWRLE